MIVISMTDCPVGLRGDLTKWLFEISTGVFVGRVSTRVREKLWERITEGTGSGKVTMVFSTNTEQHLDFRVHNSDWEPIDFDGLKLMLRPSPARTKKQAELRMGFSKAAKNQMAKRAAAKGRQKRSSTDYAVIDIETSGLSEHEDEIIELAALHIENHQVTGEFTALVQPTKPISATIENITGITNAMLQAEGIPLQTALEQFFTFVGGLPLASHNINFDYKFLCTACAATNRSLPANRLIDTLTQARRQIKTVKNYKLSTLAAHLGIKTDAAHRALADCQATHQLYEKLNENLDIQPQKC
jgi:CRISPR-associated protein Cas2